MDKKFEVELTKVERLLDKVDNDLLRQGLRSDFTIFFKNMDKTFEIYNVCMEELCGQLYLMDLAFHSRVVRKLFHNYKHQLHNIMKYQLTLQKELNVKYQQEKQWKAQQHAHQKAEELRKAKEEAKVKEQQASAKTQDYFDDEESVTTQTKFFIFASNLKVSFLPQKFPIPKS
jgi:septum formation inhibitor MinC